MSHVDEGLLHAYLDGALRAESGAGAREIADHFTDCADCRARLEEARRLRDVAGEILGAAEPLGLEDVPPFDELLARKAARSAHGAEAGPVSSAASHRSVPQRPGPARRRGVPLAWAASLLLALGAGWWARQLSAPAGAGFQSAAVEGMEAVELGRAERVESMPPPQRTAAMAPAPETAFRRVAPTDGSRAARRDADRAVASPALPQSDVAGAPPARSFAPTLEWRVVGRAEAEGRVGPVYAVEGLPILDFAVAAADGGYQTRTRQRLEGGGILELVQHPMALELDEIVVTGMAASADSRRPAAPRTEPSPVAPRPERVVERSATPPIPPAAPGAVQVSVLGYTITAHGPLPPDSLRALLRRLVPR